MIFYDVIVEIMNIHEIICKISNKAISGTSHDNLVRFSAISSFHQCLLQFYKIKTLRYALFKVSLMVYISSDNFQKSFIFGR